MKKIKLFTVLVMLISTLSYAQDQNKVVAVLEKVTRYQKSHPKLQGSFILNVSDQVRSGIFFFANSEKGQSVKLFFGQEEDLNDQNSDKFSYWVVNQNRLWIYLANQKVLVEQEIPEYFFSIGKLGAGLTHYFSEYNNVSVKEVKSDEGVVSRITFKEPKKNVAFDQVTVEITESGFLRATYATTKGKNGRTVQFSFILNKVNENPSFDETRTFRVVPSGNVQILRNVLMDSK